MALVIGSMVVMALHALTISTVRLSQRADERQAALRGDLRLQGRLRAAECRPDRMPATEESLRLVRRHGEETEGAVLLVAERRSGDAWRTVAAVGERCDLPERCEWDVVAQVCRGGVGQ